METWSYALANQLRHALLRAEELRKEILLTPLSPKFELTLRWETTVRRTHWSLSLSDSQLPQRQVEDILAKSRAKPSKEAKSAINYKEALDQIATDWLVNERPITVQTLLELHQKLLSGILERRDLGRFRDQNLVTLYQAPPPGHIERLLLLLLNHLNAAPAKENPIILAALAHIQLLRVAPFSQGNGRIGRLLSLLVLYKFGLDFKGFICLEQGYRRDLTTYHRTLQNGMVSGNFTDWLEFFVQNLITELESVLEKIRAKRVASLTNVAFTNLSERHKAILSMLDKPGQIVTNRLVQKRFRVSQITAARDLGKLKTMGLLAPIGKGRSTSYRRI